MKKLYKSMLEKYSKLNKIDRQKLFVAVSLVLALVTGYLFSETQYYTQSYDFANGIRISEGEYKLIITDDKTSGNTSPEVFTKFNYNYLIFGCSFIIYFIILHLSCSNLSFKQNIENSSDTLQKRLEPIIINGFRKIAAERLCAPTNKTSDQKIMEIYRRVLNEFTMASKKREEKIPALNLNYITLKFLQVYETVGNSGLDSHLQYEIENYLEKGLRTEYKNEVELF